MASLDQLNWERNNPGIPFNPPKAAPLGYQGMTAEQIRLERLRESGNISRGGDMPSTPSQFPAAGTSAGYELSADGKQRRQKFHDGKGGFYYGIFETNPDYKGTENTDTRDAFAIIKGVFNQYGYQSMLNELEYVDGKIFANIYGQNDIVVIDPNTGRITNKIDCSNLLAQAKVTYNPLTIDAGFVLNGIAYKKSTNTYFLTGKCWPVIVEVKLN
jgi:hypothetical protein